MNKTETNGSYYSYLPAIDTLRFVVFLFILANHSRVNLALNGHSFFFTLTGFLISYISIAELQKTKEFNFSRYLARRFLRTLPLFFLIVFICFAAKIGIEIFFDKSITTGQLWPFLLLIQNFFSLDIIFPLSNLWALGVTEQYYLLLGFLFLLIYPRWKWFGILLVLAGMFINIVSYFWLNFYAYAYSWNFLVNFGIGNLLAIFCLNKHRAYTFISTLNKTWTALYLSVATGILILGFSVHDEDFLPFKELILSIGYSLIIFNVGFGKHRPHFITEIKGLQYLGKRTLGMYCWHAVIITILGKTASYYQIRISPLQMFVLTLALVIPVSIISYRYYESYFLRLKKYFN